MRLHPGHNDFAMDRVVMSSFQLQLLEADVTFTARSSTAGPS